MTFLKGYVQCKQCIEYIKNRAIMIVLYAFQSKYKGPYSVNRRFAVWPFPFIFQAQLCSLLNFYCELKILNVSY